MKIRKIINAAMAALTLWTVVYPPLVSASNLQYKVVPIYWLRTDAVTNPNSQYSQQLSDGNHPAAGKSIAVAPQDTSQAIDISDLYWRRMVLARTTYPGSGVAADSLFGFSISLHSTASTIDTVLLKWQTSLDGINWTAVDSIGQHISSPQWTTGFAAVGADSMRLVFSTRTNINGSTEGNASINFSIYPGMANSGISGMGIADVRFVRFIIHMSPGDFAAAGTTGGVTAQFVYPYEAP